MSAFEEFGYSVIREVVPAAQCEVIASAIQSSGRVAKGARTLLTERWCRELAILLRRHPAVAQVLSAESVAAQCMLFEKSPERNWLVSLHQDLSVPVKERVTHDELNGWSVKDGNVFVQPPACVLESLVAVRLHLDECGPGAGGLGVVP